MTAGLEVAGLTKAFGQRVVIDGLELSVALGSLRCIVGPNAAGKSTLLNLIGGQVETDDGSIRVAGEEVSRLPPHRRRWLGIARSFQTPRLMPTLTVREHMLLSARRRRAVLPTLWRPMDAGRGEFSAPWCHLGLDGLAEITAEALSHTHRKLLDIALAIETSSTLLLLDEPTAGLDARSIALVQDVIEAQARSAAVLLVEHNLSFLAGLKCQVSFLYRGKIVRTGTLDEVLSQSLTRDVYLHTK